MRTGDDPRIEGARCWCNDCGWEVEFDEGAYRRDVQLERSATSRLAAHSAHSDCDYDAMEYELQYAEITFDDGGAD